MQGHAEIVQIKKADIAKASLVRYIYLHVHLCIYIYV